MQVKVPTLAIAGNISDVATEDGGYAVHFVLQPSERESKATASFSNNFRNSRHSQQ